jgi:Uncharacterized protein conserved in bacteria
MKAIVLNEEQYELKEDKKNCFNIEETSNLCTEYFKEYDYILGDYAYNKLRLKGFYEDNNKKSTDINKISYIEEYIKLYCAYECSYFILQKVKK